MAQVRIPPTAHASGQLAHPCSLLFQKPNPRIHFLMETIPLESTEPQGCWSLTGHGPGGELTSATKGHVGESECWGVRAEGRGDPTPPTSHLKITQLI